MPRTIRVLPSWLEEEDLFVTCTTVDQDLQDKPDTGPLSQMASCPSTYPVINHRLSFLLRIPVDTSESSRHHVAVSGPRPERDTSLLALNGVELHFTSLPKPASLLP